MSKQARKHRTGHLYKRGKDGKQYPANSRRAGTYYLQYMVNGKLFRKSLGTSDKREAEAERVKIMAPLQVADEKEALAAIKQRMEAAGEQYEALTEGETAVSLDDAWQAYVDSPERPDSGSTTLRDYGQYFSRFRKWLADEYPTMASLSQVTRVVALEYATDLNGGKVSGNTYNKHVGFLKLLFRVLGDRAGLDVNPFGKITRKKHKVQSRRELTVEELARVLDVAEGDMALLFGLGTFTGMRLGDCATLRWSEVDLAKKEIRRVPNKTARTSGKMVAIGMPDLLVTRLANIENRKPSEYVMPEIAEQYLNDASGVSRRIRSVFQECGIPTYKKGTGPGTKKRAVVEVDFHSLRHTYVSLHAEHGTPAAILQENVGHSNPAMTRHYTHISGSANQRYAGVLPAALGIESDELSVIGQHEELRRLVADLNSSNWRATKRRMSDLIASMQ